MRSIRTWLTIASFILVLGGAAQAASQKKVKPPPPIPTDKELGFFDNTRDEMLSSIRRVGMMPVTDMPAIFKDRDDAKQALLEAVARYLREAKFEVVDTGPYVAAFDRFNKQLGGMYEPATGELRHEVAAAVMQNARREFASKERLDAFVFVRVVASAAPWYGSYAVWDGVHERADGQPPPANAFMEFWTATGGEGSLPGLSVLVQIVSTRERVMFGRRGGIQTTAYHDLQQGSSQEFVRVDPDDLLKDTQRIDRAARVATLPLVHSPKEISLGDDDPAINARRIDLSKLPQLPPGKPFKSASPFLVGRDKILASVHRVALSPVDPDGLHMPAEVQKRYMEGIKHELAPLNWEIVDAPAARELLGMEMLKNPMFDPLTGKRDEVKASAVRKAVVNALGITPAPDAILWAGPVKTSALHKWGDVEWDGANQNGITLGPVVQKFWSGSALPGAGSGGVTAMSLSVFLADTNDTVLYRSRGGIQLMQKLKYSPPGYNQAGRAEPVDLAPSELFNDPDREMPAVHYALRALVMTPDALDREVNPAKYAALARKKKKK